MAAKARKAFLARIKNKNTRAGYRCGLDHAERWQLAHGGIPNPHTLKPKTIEPLLDWYVDQPLSPGSLIVYLTGLARYFEASDNYSVAAKIKRYRREIKDDKGWRFQGYTPETVCRALVGLSHSEYRDTNESLFFIVAFGTGFRICDLLQVRKKDFRFSDHIVHLNKRFKGGAHDRVLHPWLAPILLHHRAFQALSPDDLLFPGDRSTWAKKSKRVLTATGMDEVLTDFHPHRTRHTFDQCMLDALGLGAGGREISARVDGRKADVNSSEFYSRLSPYLIVREINQNPTAKALYQFNGWPPEGGADMHIIHHGIGSFEPGSVPEPVHLRGIASDSTSHKPFK